MKLGSLPPFVAVLMVILLAPWQGAQAAQYTDPTGGYSFTYPDDWIIEPHEGGTIVRNFPVRQYLHGGTPPMGGAEIGVGSYAPYPSWWPPDTDEYQWLEHFAQGFAGNTVTVLVHPSRSAPGPARLVYTLPTPAGTVETDVSIALHKGGRVFRFHLTYQTADPSGPAHEQVLAGVTDSLTLATQPTATPATPLPAPTASGVSRPPDAQSPR